MKKAVLLAAAFVLTACSGSTVSSDTDTSSAAEPAPATTSTAAYPASADEASSPEADTAPPVTVYMPPQDQSILSDPQFIASGGKEIYDLLDGRFPFFSGTDVTFCPTGEAFWEELLGQLKTAQKTIDMEYFIIEHGEMLDAVTQVLKERSEAGVKVRVLYDGLIVSDSDAELLAQTGAECKPYVAPSHGSVNNRDHRKLTVIDGSTAFMGGANLADEYINKVSPYGHWKDCAVMIKGSAVQSCSALFEQQWGGTEEPPPVPPVVAEGYVMPVGESPFDNCDVSLSLITDLLSRAEKSVYITAPYLTITDSLEKLICSTAERGVEVVMIVPGISDKDYTEVLARTHFKALVRSGVKLYRYDPGFIHAKIYSSDGSRALVGSMNLNSRSFKHDFECGIYMIGSPAIKDIDTDFNETLKSCTLLTEDKIKEPTEAEKLKSKLLENLAPYC